MFSPVEPSAKLMKPRPWANSCSATLIRSTNPLALPSKPRYQPEPARQPAWPRFELNVTSISALEGTKSVAARLFARAAGYQCAGKGAPAKSLEIVIGPADPSTALPELHG